MSIKIPVLICTFLFFQCKVISQINERLGRPVKRVDPTKKCHVILRDGKGYVMNPNDIDSRSSASHIPAYREAKIVKSGNDYDVFFPNTGYNGHLLTFYETDGVIMNYYSPFGQFPFDTLRAHGIYLIKSDSNRAVCYIEVKTPTGSFRDGVKRQSNFFELSNMYANDVGTGSYYDVNVYSFRDSGRFLDQQFKVYLKTCTETNVLRCQ